MKEATVRIESTTSPTTEPALLFCFASLSSCFWSGMGIIAAIATPINTPEMGMHLVRGGGRGRGRGRGRARVGVRVGARARVRAHQLGGVVVDEET